MQGESAVPNNSIVGVDMESLTKQYYQRLYPFRAIYDWLSYGNVEKDYFVRREFSYSLKSDSGEDIYARYNSYADVESFSKAIKTAKNILKIDIGAVYSASPRDRMSFGKAFIPLEKELVFDIDMTDYDQIRTCCSGASICHKCWPFMTIAIQILHKMLTEEFGFSNLLWIYSGRRGVHCWVADSRARKLSQEARSAIVQYMSVITGGENKSRKVELGLTLHPSLRRAYADILLPWFEEHIMVDQKLLQDPKSVERILNSIPDEGLRKRIGNYWEDHPDHDDLQKWLDLKATVESAMQKDKKTFQINPIFDIVFTHTYPRLDVHVSDGLNHLLKAPFCVHPSTGRVCVPIDPERCAEFDPFKVPTAQQLIGEIDNFSLGPDSNKKLKEYKKTSLKPYIEFFKTKFLRPLQESIKTEKRQEELKDVKMGEASLDF